MYRLFHAGSKNISCMLVHSCKVRGRLSVHAYTVQYTLGVPSVQY